MQEQLAKPATRTTGAVTAFGFSHAPQIFLAPSDEDPAQVAAMRDAYGRIGDRAAELDLDLLVLVGLDHLHNHFLDLIPMFTVFTGSTVRAHFAGTDVECRAAPDHANGLLDRLLAEDFDPAFSQHQTLDHSFMIPLHYALAAGLSVPVIPIIVNAYVAPQPSIRRCHSFGRVVGRWARDRGLRIGLVGTGGLSHFPGTSRYHEPDLDADRELLDWFQSGDIEPLLTMTAEELDARGIVELRTWALALGALAVDRVTTNFTYYASNFHCGYAAIEFAPATPTTREQEAKTWRA